MEGKTQMTVNKKRVTVFDKQIKSSTTLATFLRDQLHLTGTKVSCASGGCGACVVNAEVPMKDGSKEHISVNSCLIPLAQCQDWNITTIEGLGSKKNGFHPIQQRLSNFHGTQCGFCTPGMIMTMNNLLRNKGNPEQAEVERCLDGNICRCTGYRPILDAFKSFSSDAPQELKEKVIDMEDLDKFLGCSNGSMNGSHQNGTEAQDNGDNLCQKLRDGTIWHHPTTLDELSKLMKDLPKGQYRLVAGNTSTGIYDEFTGYKFYVDVTKVPELTMVDKSSGLTFGANVSLSKAIEELKKSSSKIANVAVRNVGTLGGNLMIKHGHKDFPSDVFVTLEALQAKLKVLNIESGARSDYLPSQWLSVNMTNKILLSINIPNHGSNAHFKSFKISQRSQNSHAYVNAAFCMDISKADNFKVLSKPAIVYGGISESFDHLTSAENSLTNKELGNSNTLKEIFNLLERDVKPDDNPAHSSAEYRVHLCKALFYKFVLSLMEDKLPEALKSGGKDIMRGISRGEQSFQTDPDLYPINKPIKKLEADAQCSGEAEYVADTPPLPDELFAAFVITSRSDCELDTVDPTPALHMPGVVAFIDHKDIPGQNNLFHGRFVEEIFSSGKIHYAGQAIGLIVARDRAQALAAVKKVKIGYKNEKTPVLSIREAIEIGGDRISSDPALVFHEVNIGDTDIFKVEDSQNLEETYGEPVKAIEGEIDIGSQYHFHMETHTCIVRPIEDGQFEVLSSTQFMSHTQSCIAKALDLPMNHFDMKVRRIGGAFGGKITKGNLTAVACAIAAYKLNKPVRIVLDLETNMKMIGKRLPYLGKYKVVAGQDGKIKSVGMKLYCDCGYTFNDVTVGIAVLMGYAQNCYNSPNWRVIPTAVVTNKASNTYVRAPGSTQGHAIIEHVMEHMATALNMDPLEFRKMNMLKEGDALFDGQTFQHPENPAAILLEKIKVSSKFVQRRQEILQYNQENRWKKRGISIIPARYGHHYFPGLKFRVHVSIFADDGTVAVAHGGIEMGQGLNTKVAQTVAKELGITVDMIKVKSTQNLIAPNDFATGGCMGSELCPSGALYACRDLKGRMKAVKQKMDNPDPNWREVVEACNKNGVDLTASHMAHPSNDAIKGYDVWAAVVTEVEVDMLTGELNIRRSDIIEDVGMAISPEVDIGQVEGGYVMGLGLYTTEQIRFNKKTGELVTASTWDYFPPMSENIPQDLRTTFYNSGNNPNGVMGSKATGEPSVLMGVGVMFAIRNAIKDARKDAGYDPNEWFKLDAPATPEEIFRASQINSNNFILH